MKDADKLIFKLKEKLEGMYEHTTLKILKNTNGAFLYVDFNDTYDNSLVVYAGEKGGISIANMLCLNSDDFKSSTEWEETANIKSLDAAVDFFHKCYKKMVSDVDEFEGECRSALKDFNMDSSELFPGEKLTPIGKRKK
ncbi:hypothetical protein HY643_00990 [Candidatus Woesearchaeota archaeon]|nr:hypothetical protein [Candidatus Woesearchaeota archaeon]